VEDQLQASWDRQSKSAREHDDGEYSWGPPQFGALITAVQATSLTRFYPFTSHWVLRFRANENIPGDPADIAPGSIALGARGIYEVQSGAAWSTSATKVLATADPGEAATALERLLATWDKQRHDLRLEY
jgi:hypothetical protein